MRLAHISNHRLLIFGLVGTLGFVVDGSVFMVGLHLLNLSPFEARGIAFLVALTVTWYGNRTFTFINRTHSNKISQWQKYFFAASVSAIPNFTVFFLIISSLPASEVSSLVAMVGGILTGMLSNFWLCDRFVFRKTTAHDM